MSTANPILVADDDENDLYLMEHALKGAEIRHPLEFAHDGQEAIERLSERAKASAVALAPLPCLLIVDLKMPRRTGMDVLVWLRGQPVLKSLPVIMFSSSAHRHDIERAYMLGANAFVVKPASTTQRLEFARLIKSFWLELSEPPLMCSEGFAAALRLHETKELPPSGAV